MQIGNVYEISEADTYDVSSYPSVFAGYVELNSSNVVVVSIGGADVPVVAGDYLLDDAINSHFYYVERNSDGTTTKTRIAIFP